MCCVEPEMACGAGRAQQSQHWAGADSSGSTCVCPAQVWHCPQDNRPRVLKACSWNNPCLCRQQPRWGQGDQCCLRSRGFGACLGRLSVILPPGWEVLTCSPLLGVILCGHNTDSWSNSGPKEILITAGGAIAPVLTSSFKGSECINSKNWNYSWTQNCLDNQACQQHHKMQGQTIPQPVI